MGPLETIARTAAALVRQGHCKYTYARDAAGEDIGYHADAAVSFCARGALFKAGDGQATEWRVFWDLNGLIGGAKNPADISSTEIQIAVPEWNDKPERTGGEVAAKLEELAYQYAKEGL